MNGLYVSARVCPAVPSYNRAPFNPGTRRLQICSFTLSNFFSFGSNYVLSLCLACRTGSVSPPALLPLQ